MACHFVMRAFLDFEAALHDILIDFGAQAEALEKVPRIARAENILTTPAATQRFRSQAVRSFVLW